jgi:hypothetical protein
MKHAIKKFWSTLCICGRIIMARTFGQYVHSGWNGDCDYARYRWRGHDYFIQITPAKPSEPKPLACPRIAA